MYKTVCIWPVCHLLAGEVSQDQQFWDVTVHLPMSLLGSVQRGR